MILLRRCKPKVFFPKIAWFIHRVERIDAAQVWRRRGIVSEYLVTVDRGLRAEPPAAGNFCDFAAKNSDFNAILITFHTFWSHMNN